MAKKIVSDYKISWDVKRDKYKIEVKLQGENRLRRIPISRYQEFQSLLVILQGPKTVYIDIDKSKDRFIVSTL